MTRRVLTLLREACLGNVGCQSVNRGVAYDAMEDALKVSALGDRLRSAREVRGLTLDQLSASTGISKAHLSRLESGARQPSVGILVELAGALGTRVGTLLGEDAAGAPLATFSPDAPRAARNSGARVRQHAV
jgi:ribosome-binding protein aMBF1 (putative translation factor)